MTITITAGGGYGMSRYWTPRGNQKERWVTNTALLFALQGLFDFAMAPHNYAEGASSLRKGGFVASHV